MSYSILKVIDACCNCPCLKYEYELCLCSLYERTNKPPQMKHDVDEGIDPECPLKKANYVLSLRDKLL